MKNKLKYEGSVIHNSKYGDIVIVEYKTTEEVIAQFVKTGSTVTTSLNNLLRGSVKDRFSPTVYGVGIVGNVKCNVGGVVTKEYGIWRRMLQRCYCPLYIKDRPTYIGCYVSDEFKKLEVFKSWCLKQPNFNEVDDKGKPFVLDKDILVKGNKVYSPETCCFVPSEVNLLFVKSDKLRGSLPIGVNANGYRGYRASLCCHGKNKTLGQFKTCEEAFQAYKVAKESYIKEVANKWKGKLTQETYSAMLNYVVSEND